MQLRADFGIIGKKFHRDGRKEFAGTLAGFEDGAVLLDMGGAEPVRFEKNEVALVRLRVEF